MKKLKSKKGFTLLEMLACCITLLLITGICTAGTNIAINSYNRSVFTSDSQTLEATLEVYISDLLRHATIKSNGNNGVESITNLSYGMYEGMLTDKSGRLVIYKNPEDATGVMFVNENVYANTLYIEDFKLEYYPAEHYVTGTYTIKSTVVENAERKCEFTYRIVTMY